MPVSEITEADLPAVTALSAQLGYPDSLETMRVRYQAIAKDARHKIWVMREGDKITGWLHAAPLEKSMIHSPMVEVSALVVDEAARGSGVGKALLRHAEDWARGLGFPEIRLHSNVKREHAHEFYARQGYEKRKTCGVFFKKL